MNIHATATATATAADAKNESHADDDDDDENESLISTVHLPAYLAEAFGELYGEDGLMVLGQGMGLLPLLTSFIRFMADVKNGHVSVTFSELDDDHYCGRAHEGERVSRTGYIKPPLVFVLGLKEAEWKAIFSMLQHWGTPPDMLPTLVTNESGQGKERAALYRRGGVFIITSRILIVDLLTNVASPLDIEGILVAHAESVTEQSTEAFILRIYRTQQSCALAVGRRQVFGTTGPTITPAAGFIKAFTGDPAALLAGFAKVDKILKALNVRRLFLYPRFHTSVVNELERFQPEVEELHQELTPPMKEIQRAIAAAVQTCIRELKSSTTLIEWTDPDITLENCVTKNFDMAISRQLDQDWHRLKPQTKQLVNDLRTLRNLFQYLIHYDCVSFWKLIQNLKTMSAASRYPSMWLLTPAGDMLFRKAKERLYRLSIPRATKEQPNPVGVLIPILEENPKWSLLSKILTEVKNDWQKKQKIFVSSIRSDPRLSFEGGARVLIMVKDDRTLETIRAFLVDGKERTMTLRWLKFLESHNEVARSLVRGSGGASGLTEEQRLLLEEEGRARNLLFGKGKGYHEQTTATAAALDNKGRKRQSGALPDWMKKRRRINAERHRGHRTLEEDDVRQRAILDEAVAETEQDLITKSAMLEVPARPETMSKSQASSSPSSSDDNTEKMCKAKRLDELRVVVRTYASVEGELASLLLDDLRPSYIILYDANASFIRSIECHTSTIAVGGKNDRLKVYFMLFQSSSEEKGFLKSLEREQNAFERLIKHKKCMPLPVNTIDAMTQEMQQAQMTGVAGSYAKGSLPLSVDTRTGRGKQRASNEKRDIAVDVREFRSALPSILHRGGMRLAPVTLTVGDFVLSNVHCVERKSISDLFGSFASGRLYTQAEAMSKHYKCPCLLIEFDPSKSFSLQSPNELGSEIRTDSVCSKMSLLTMHFPRLRLLWSREPHETLKIFKVLKMNHEEVDVEKAVEVGSNESLDEMLGIDTGVVVGSYGKESTTEGGQNEVNEAARDILLRLPGINVNNARKVMSACDSIAELAEMSRDELKQLLGPITGQKLFTFLRQQLAAS